MEYRYFSCTYVVVCCVVSCIIRNICNGTFIVLLNLYLIFIWMNGYFACCFFNLCYLGIILYHMISKQLSVNVFFLFPVTNHRKNIQQRWSCTTIERASVMLVQRVSVRSFNKLDHRPDVEGYGGSSQATFFWYMQPKRSLDLYRVCSMYDEC